MKVYPYHINDYPVIEMMYTSIDKFTGKSVPCGYIIDDNILYLPRGTSIGKLESILNVRANIIDEDDSSEQMSKQFKSLYDPRDDLQLESIKFLMEPSKQSTLNTLMGTGKSFCVAYSSTMLNKKTLIITHNEGLKQQWIKTYNKMFNYRSTNLMNINGSSIIESIMNDEIKPADVYFVNHQTLRSYLYQYNGYTLHRFFKKLNIGIKVYDEAHLEFHNIIVTDFFSNTERTWYLTATFDRSDKTESICFKRAFNSVSSFGEWESRLTFDKHVIYHVVNVNSRATPKEKAKVIGYQGFTAASYGKYAFFVDDNQTAYTAIKIIIEKIKSIDGKILIFVPLIDAIDTILPLIKKEFPEKSVGAYHSRLPKDEKESSLKKDIIISTIKSCGVGKDIPELRSIICLEPIASKVIAAQMIGRLRPYKDKPTYFFDVIDNSFQQTVWFWKSRLKKIQELVKETIYLNIDK
jgi:superfamily II DNA or RNA helicase